ncbi:hypothetical protein RHECNPAF_730046 [Rhizobium etli CNPAF512]|nr:hypothetical protein RHECNPAF_730046 [Rhizobium etli CNPAF512]
MLAKQAAVSQSVHFLPFRQRVCFRNCGHPVRDMR